MAMPSLNFTDEKVRWTAIVDRIEEADGSFYYAVKTTGVYCRPSCGSRQPRRENVVYYQTIQEAEKEGFRPCKRCQPNEAKRGNIHAGAVAKACRIIEESEEHLTLAQLAAAVSMSSYHFHRIFKRMTGVTPKAYSIAHRSNRVKDELVQQNSVTEAIYNAGYNSNGRFYASSSKELGMTPTQYRSGGKGEKIQFALGECSLGSILVAASEKGICAILMGNDPELLIQDLQARFSDACLNGPDKDFEQWVATVVGFVDQPQLGLDLPLDIRGTAFQHKVWRALCDIPVGSTVTYKDVAQKIGIPKGARAIAGACSANAIAVAIPCHRVVRNDGSLSGYRWGVERKKKLLDQEAIQ